MEESRLIAIAAADDQGLDGEVSAHFGRCPYYIMVAIDNGQPGAATVVPNPYFQAHRPGVLPGFLHDHGADVILAGGMGPRAIGMFQGFGMEVATGAMGKVSKVLKAYVRGELRGTAPCAHDHPDRCGEHDRGRGRSRGRSQQAGSGDGSCGRSRGR